MVKQIFENRLQYCVPFYQRAYVWTRDNQWEQLWEDIQTKAEARLSGGTKITPHFLGAVVLEGQDSDGLRGVPRYHIIDGQQRMTTLQYILKAVTLALEEIGQSASIDPAVECTSNGKPESMIDPAVEVFKVWPTFRDQENYKRAMTAAKLRDLRTRFPQHFTQAGELKKIGVSHPPALEALWYFAGVFKQWLLVDSASVNERSDALLLAILRDFKVVTITLEEGDDAQIIFETLNGRGAQLHATDLVRNFIFMRADREGEKTAMLYNELWAQFETPYWSKEQRRGRINKPRLEWLVHSMLQAELREEVELSRLYHEYRRFAASGKKAPEQLETLNRYAGLYRELIEGTGDSPIARFGRRIADYDVTTLYPLSLLIGASEIEDVEKNAMYDVLVSYFVRRAICGLTAKNYNNIFAGLLRQLDAKSPSEAQLRNILQGWNGNASRWPTDDEFEKACLVDALYPDRLDARKMRRVLTELEHHLIASTRTEDRQLNDYPSLDIDHIMPQSWYEFWPLDDHGRVTKDEAASAGLAELFGETPNERQQAIIARQRAIPTLGNLTLLNLSVNRQAQNHAFSEKRDLLIANTNLRLNIQLLRDHEWNEASIRRRGHDLAQVALNIWVGPKIAVA